MKHLLLLLLLTATAFAGCSDGGDDKGDVPTGPATEDDLEKGKGAIAGLLIDDRYRPLAGGLVLLQPAGLTATSDANGEFQFVNIAPGQYTARVSIEGHEAAPMPVRVEEGTFAELNLEARRILSEGSFTITEEYSVFIPCSFAVPVTVVTFNCVFDLSGDTFRSAAGGLNYTAYNATWLVMEFEINKVGSYVATVRPPGTSSTGEAYGSVEAENTNYGKVVVQKGVANERSTVWNNTGEVEVALFVQGQVQQVTTPENPVFYEGTWGIGADVGIRGHFVITVFVDEPEVDPTTYQAIQPAT